MCYSRDSILWSPRLLSLAERAELLARIRAQGPEQVVDEFRTAMYAREPLLGLTRGWGLVALSLSVAAVLSISAINRLPALLLILYPGMLAALIKYALTRWSLRRFSTWAQCGV